MDAADPFRNDPELAEMLRRLRFERDQELAELEDEAERLQAKQSTLPAVAIMAMMAGEGWNVAYAERSFEGRIVHVGGDFVGMADRAGNLADISFEAIEYISHLASTTDGRAPVALRPATLRGRLLGLQEDRPVEIGGTSGKWALSGSIESVNTDHLSMVMTSGVRASVPLSSIGFVLRRPIASRRG